YMFFILQAKSLFTGKLSIIAPILLYILFNIFYASLSIPFGKLSDKIGRKKVILAGYLLFSMTSFGFAFLNSLASLIILFAFYGVVYAAIDGNQRAFVADLSPQELKSTALGTFHTAIGISALPASLIAGFLWQTNPKITFLYGGITSATAVVLFLALQSKIKVN
ncbi:MAG TPA: MFS transporter, partial [Candidatus Portnoybacteria bacterium]|nr:MFS transporter [Candidatus Portnoybacteria bacterium]